MGKFYRKYPKKKVVGSKVTVELPTTDNNVKVVLTPPIPSGARPAPMSNREVERIAKVIGSLSDEDIKTFVEHTAHGGDKPAGAFAIIGGDFGGGFGGVAIGGKVLTPKQQPEPPKQQPKGQGHYVRTQNGQCYENVVAVVVIEDGKQVIKWL